MEMNVPDLDRKATDCCEWREVIMKPSTYLYATRSCSVHKRVSILEARSKLESEALARLVNVLALVYGGTVQSAQRKVLELCLPQSAAFLLSLIHI